MNQTELLNLVNVQFLHYERHTSYSTYNNEQNTKNGTDYRDCFRNGRNRIKRGGGLRSKRLISVAN